MFNKIYIIFSEQKEMGIEMNINNYSQFLTIEWSFYQ